MSTVKRHENDALVEQFNQLQAKLPKAKFPELKVVTVKEDGEERESLRCPRCGNLIADGTLFAVDASVRQNPVGYIYDTNIDLKEIDVYGEDSEYGTTLYYLHGDNPGHAVSLPEGWSEEWV